MSINHAVLSPSSAKRWINCPGSVALCAGVPPLPASVHAAEGTVAHGLAEELVSGQADSLELMGRIGHTVKCEGFDIEITDEMVDAAIEYADTIAADRKRLQANGRPAELHGREEVRVYAKSVDEAVFGTSDYILYRKGDTLIVYDFKYGRGVTVDAEENEQMAIYAVGVMDTLAGWAFDNVELVIVQPRASHADGTVRRWATSVAWLTKFRDDLKKAVEATRTSKVLEAGAWCRWCPAKAVCPEMHGAVQRQAQADFSAAPPPKELAKMEARLPEIRLMTNEQLVAAFRWEEAINSFFEGVKETLRERLASHPVAGVKLVEGKSNRQWKDEDAVVAEFKPVIGDAVFNTKVKSPAQLEKIVGKGKVDHLTFKPEGKKSVALDTDPRPPAKSSAVDDFTEKPKALAADVRDDELMAELTGAAPKKEPIWPM